MIRKVALGFCLVFALVFWLASRESSGPKLESSKPSPPAAILSETSKAIDPAPEGNWTYSQSVDEMGRKRRFANKSSTNTFELDFPYQGIQRGTMTLRLINNSGLSIMITIEKGQILCGFDNCSVPVRFDDGPIQHYSASPSSSHDATILFINNEARFLSSLKKSKKVVVEPNIYQHGPTPLVFEVGGFEWMP